MYVQVGVYSIRKKTIIFPQGDTHLEHQTTYSTRLSHALMC